MVRTLSKVRSSFTRTNTFHSATNLSRFYSSSLTQAKQFQAQLKLINTNPHKVLDESYLLSNESGWDKVLNKLASSRPIAKPLSSCALLTGESHFLSALPEFLKHAKTIVFNDVDIEVHNHIRLTLALIARSNHKDKFIESYYHLLREHFYELVPDTYHFHRDLKERQAMVGDFDFLHSQQRYLVCQQAARAARIFYSHCNLFDERHVGKFSYLLGKNALHLTLMNISNIGDYDNSNQLATSLTGISFHKPLILRSTYVDHPKGVVAQTPAPYEAYLEELKHAKPQSILSQGLNI